ncbi:pilus assembly protein PilB [Lysinibacillus sp. 2017]|nr:pilus assembly protein PilB [Lysinibacillus sp. 2017]
MELKNTTKIILLPLIVSILITLSLLIFEGDVLGLDFYLLSLLFVFVFLAIYFFTVIFVLPLYLFFIKRFKNVLISLFLLNIIGLFIIGCIDIWLVTIFNSKSLYMIYPLFSILSLARFNQHFVFNH